MRACLHGSSQQRVGNGPRICNIRREVFTQALRQCLQQRRADDLITLLCQMGEEVVY